MGLQNTGAMTKVREIKNCFDCRDFDGSRIPFRCKLEKREIQTIDYRIPDWCPLPDTEKPIRDLSDTIQFEDEWEE